MTEKTIEKLAENLNPAAQQTTTDPHLITDLDGLRQVIGTTHPQARQKVQERIDEFASAFLARSPFLILSTADVNGNVDASPKGDSAGFVQVLDETTLVIPDRPGNKLAFGHENILQNPKVGLLFLIPGTRETLRINGQAQLTTDPALLESLAARNKAAVLAIRVRVEEVFFHCAKAFIRSGLWQHDSWAEPHKVSFGEMYRKYAGTDEQAARALDSAIAADYENNL